MRTFSLVFFLATFFSGGLGAQAPSNPDYRGLYIVWPQVAGLPPIKVTQLTEALYVPGINGFVLDISWSAIEPSRGQFQWSALDSWLLPAVAAGKKLDVGIEAGTYTPSWLYAAPPAGAGAAQINFVWSDQGGADGQCTPITMPLPWDAGFLAEWDAMLNALSAHLKAVGAYGSVDLVRLTGVNTNTDELKLPVTTPATTGLSCVTDAIASWQKAGYTPTLLLKGWDQITNSFQMYFPDKTLVLPVLVANALPPIDDSGNMMKGSRQEDNLAEVEMAAQKFPSRLVVLQTTIQLGTPPGTEMAYAAHILNTAIAFQTNEWLNSGAACGGTLAKPVPCTTALFEQMVEAGLYPFGKSDPVRSPFIEVFPPNALALPDAMIASFNEIVPNAVAAVIPNNGVVIHGGSSGIVSPGSLVDIYGTNLPANAAAASGGQNLPLGLGGSTVSVAGVAAPLLYAGPGTVVFQMPFGVPAGQASVTLSVNGAPSLPVPVMVNAAATELLTWGQARAVVQNQDYSLNMPGNGAQPGSTAIAYLTGSGPLNQAVATGAPSPASPPAMETETTEVTIGGASAAVSFAGLCPGLIGVVQVNFVVPVLAAGDYPLQINIGTAVSNTAAMTVSN
jgi:uncharacterized protein (TIGR03437 family)